jgi:hypothetical protein
VPRAERSGEVRIGKEAAMLRNEAVARIEALQLESARSMIPGAFEPNAAPHRQSTGVAVVHNEPAPEEAAIQGPYRLTVLPQPTTWTAQSAAVFGDVALVVGLIFVLTLVPVLAVQGIAAAARLLFGALGANG